MTNINAPADQSPLAQASAMLDKAGANWDKAFRKFADEPTPTNMRVYKAAEQAYTQAQRTYLLAVTVSKLTPAAVSTPVILSPNS